MARPVVQEPADTPPVTRLSPLYCRYNGFLLGQFLFLAFAECGRPRYAERRSRLLECLRELDIDVPIPASPHDAGAVTYAGLLSAILPRLVQQARELAEFAILGGLLAHYTVASRLDADAAAAMRPEIERLRVAYDLPPIDPARFASPGDPDPDRVVAPSLAYLREIVARLPVERDTALVLMPYAAPHAAVFASFHRPAIEHCGFRAVRTWDGLAGADHAELVLALIDKAGLLWADVSALDHGMACEIGSAQALGKLTILVVSEDGAASVPAHLGRDPVVRYDPRADDWPDGAVLLMSACVAALALAAERGNPLRLTPNSVEGVFDEVSQALGRILLPPAAREAQRRGRRAMDGGDLAVAEASFDEACRLGLNDDETKLWRGWARLGLGRFDEAAADLGAVLGRHPLESPASGWRPIAAYLRAVLREAQGDLAGALKDFELAVALGLSDADVREKRDALAARVTS
jgi:tetratricopeptide (TPR) repeat protein